MSNAPPSKSREFAKKASSTMLAAIMLVGVGSGTAMAQTATADDEQAQLAQLYAQANATGGQVTVYMGGDAPGQWNSLADAFSAQYPGIQINIVTDLSKYHDARIDGQLATHNLVADVAILQTVQDFTRWKSNGDLLSYKPVGWNQIYSNAKDEDGYWTGVFYGAFADMVNTGELPADPAAFTASDLLDAKYKNKLIFTYPNDDDAVLFDFKLTVDKYGWDWLQRLVAQKPTFLRGTPGSGAGVASGEYLATLGTSANPSPAATIVLPRSDPFNTWVQHGAIFKDAPHQATAKLFMSWLTSQTEQQQAIATWTWSVRQDVAPPTGRQPLSSYTNTNPADFAAFMADRGAVERFRSQLQLYVGSVTGPDPADPDGNLGLAPGQP